MDSKDKITSGVGHDKDMSIRLKAASPLSEDYYPFMTRRLLHLFKIGALTNVSTIDLEPEYGYAARINYANGTHRIVYGGDLGLNTGAARSLARDKGYTKYMLRKIGIERPEGDEFLMPHWVEALRNGPRFDSKTNMRTVDDVPGYLQSSFGYPAYVKPVRGSHGSKIFKVYDQADLDAVFEFYEEKKVHVAIVEKSIEMPDYRILTLDGELISAYLRVPLAVVGDGRRTIAQLIEDLNGKFADEGRDTRVPLDDPRMASHIAKRQLTIESTPGAGEEVVLIPVSNLSAGGTSIDVTSSISSRWVELAAFVARNFNLRLCGLDLACEDITDASSSYSVLEVNSVPGLDHYARSGEAQQKVVDDLYTKVLNAY